MVCSPCALSSLSNMRQKCSSSGLVTLIKRMPLIIANTDKEKQSVTEKRNRSSCRSAVEQRTVRGQMLAYREIIKKAIKERNKAQSKPPNKTRTKLITSMGENPWRKHHRLGKTGRRKRSHCEKERETAAVDIMTECEQPSVMDATKDCVLKTEVLDAAEGTGPAGTVPNRTAEVVHRDDKAQQHPQLTQIKAEMPTVFSSSGFGSASPSLQYLLENCCPDESFLGEAIAYHEELIAEATNCGSMPAEDSFSDISDDSSFNLNHNLHVNWTSCGRCDPGPMWHGGGIYTTAGKTGTKVSTSIVSPARSTATQQVPWQTSSTCAYGAFQLPAIPPVTWSQAPVSVMWMLDILTGMSVPPISFSPWSESLRCRVDVDELQLAAKAQCCGSEADFDDSVTLEEEEDEEEEQESVEPYPGFITPSESEDEEDGRHDLFTDFFGGDLDQKFDDIPVKGSAHVMNNSLPKAALLDISDFPSHTLIGPGHQATSTPLDTSFLDSDSSQESGVEDDASDSQLDTSCPSPVGQQADPTSRKRKRETSKCHTALKFLKLETRIHPDSWDKKDVRSPVCSLDGQCSTVPQRGHSPCEMETNEIREGDKNPSLPLFPTSVCHPADWRCSSTVPQHVYSPCGKTETEVLAASKDFQEGDNNPSLPLSPTDSQSSEESGVGSSVGSPAEWQSCSTVPQHVYCPCREMPETKVQAFPKDLKVGDKNPSFTVSPMDSESWEESRVGSSVSCASVPCSSDSLPSVCHPVDTQSSSAVPQHEYTPWNKLETKIEAASKDLKAVDTKLSPPLSHRDSWDESGVRSSVSVSHLDTPFTTSALSQHRETKVQAASKDLKVVDTKFSRPLSHTGSLTTRCVRSSVHDRQPLEPFASLAPQHRLTEFQTNVLCLIEVTGRKPSPDLCLPRHEV